MSTPASRRARETFEETGLVVRLGTPLPLAEYPILDATGAPATKIVHYWAAVVTGGSGKLLHEIDEVAWVDVRTANDRLDYARDREQLLAIVRAERAGELDTWPLALVRHAKATPRSKWKGDDRQRPLDAVGPRPGHRRRRRARRLRRDPRRQPRRRCAAAPPCSRMPCAQGLRLRARDGPVGGGLRRVPDGAPRELERLLAKGEPAALCSHGPVLPSLLESLGSASRAPSTRGLTTRLRRGRTLARCARARCSCATCSGRGERRALVDVERIDT